MHIANPIYDVVFKYLMEDAKIAKLMIAAIIGEEILELKFASQEFVGETQLSATNTKTASKKKKVKEKLTDRFGLTIYRLDFAAKIKTAEGEKQVIIELQKAKYPTDIMRFRKYLGEQFRNKENTQTVLVSGKSRKIGLPIISIYFLGHKLDNTEASAIKVSRQYTDLITNELITKKEHFIESLTLDSYVIQIPFLASKRRNELEILLSVFDQSSAIDVECHVLSMNETDFPEKYRPIIRKLHQAVQLKEIKTHMELEDGIIDELEDMERQIEELELKNQALQKEKEKAALLLEMEKMQTEQKVSQAEQKVSQAEQKASQAELENEELRRKIEELLAHKKE